MQKREYRSPYQIVVYLMPFDNRTEITVNKFADVRGKQITWTPAYINWPGIGPTTPERTEQFAAALVEAAKVARRLDEECLVDTPVEATN